MAVLGKLGRNATMTVTTVLLTVALSVSIGTVGARRLLQVLSAPEGAKTTGEYPYGLSSGLTNATKTGQLYCEGSTQSNDGFDYVSRIQLTTEISTKRLVGISLTCSEGTTIAAYSGGRTGPTSQDSTTSAIGNNFKGGFNAVAITSGAVGEPARDGGDIVSGIQFLSISNCDSSPIPITASVTGGSNNTLYGNPPRTRDFCQNGNLLIGFQYGTSAYFDGFMPLYYAF